MILGAPGASPAILPAKLPEAICALFHACHKSCMRFIDKELTKIKYPNFGIRDKMYGKYPDSVIRDTMRFAFGRGLAFSGCKAGGSDHKGHRINLDKLV